MKVYEKHNRFGVSYRPTSRHPDAREGKRFNPIRFNNANYQLDSSVAIIDGASSSQHAIFSFIRKCPLGFKLDKWTSTVIHVVFSDKM